MSGYSGASIAAFTEPDHADRPADRRAHPRIPSIEIPGTRIRIPHRPDVALVDLSSGGALIALPFQTHPQSRLTLEISSAADQVTMPFQLLRCYVAQLKGGVRYHAAGVFDGELNLAALTGRAALDRDRLIGSFERLLRVHQAAEAGGCGRRFDDIVAMAVAGFRRGESTDLVAVRIKSRLIQLYPSLTICPSSSSLQREALTSAQFFGFTFSAGYALTAEDRRFLKLSAQLIAMMDDCRRTGSFEEFAERHLASPKPPTVILNTADWLATRAPADAGSTRPRKNIELVPPTAPAARAARPRAEGAKAPRPRWLMGLL